MRKNKLTKTLLTSALALTLAVSALILGSSKPAFAAETTTAAETTAAAEDATVVAAPRIWRYSKIRLLIYWRRHEPRSSKPRTSIPWDRH